MKSDRETDGLKPNNENESKTVTENTISETVKKNKGFDFSVVERLLGVIEIQCMNGQAQVALKGVAIRIKLLDRRAPRKLTIT